MARSVLLASVLVLACFAEASPAAAANVAVLMPGSSGIVPGDFLVRNEGRFQGAGIRTIMTTSPSSNPCNAQGAHGFFKQDGPAVSAIIAFVKSH